MGGRGSERWRKMEDRDKGRGEGKGRGREEGSTWMIFTEGLKRGGFPKWRIQFSRAPSRRITSASFSALTASNNNIIAEHGPLNQEDHKHNYVVF